MRTLLRCALFVLLAVAPATANPDTSIQGLLDGECVGPDRTVRVASTGTEDVQSLTVTANGDDVTGSFAACSDPTDLWGARPAIGIHPRRPGGHAFFLPSLPGGPRYVFDGPASFTEHADGSAVLKGIIAAQSNPVFRWAVEVWFLPNTTAQPRLELRPQSYVPRGPIDPTTWRFYDMDGTRANLTGLGVLTGQSVQLFQRSNAGGRYAFQVGVGANGTNHEMGLSGWLGTSGSYNANSGFLNVDLLNGSCLEARLGDLGVDDGQVTLEVTASTGSGQDRTSVTFEYDGTAPSLTITPANGAVLAEDQVDLIVDYSDSGCGLDLSSFSATLDGQPVTFSVGANQATATVEPGDGSHILVVTLLDQAGNLGQATSTFQVEPGATALELSISPGSPTNLLVDTENDLTIRAVTPSGTTATDFVGNVLVSAPGSEGLLDGLVVPFTAADQGQVTVSQLAFYRQLGDFTLSAQALEDPPQDIQGELAVHVIVASPIIYTEPPPVTALPNLALDGVSYPGLPVELVLNGRVVATTSAGSNGLWSTTVTLAPGTNEIFAQAVDPGDGQTKTSQTLTVELECTTITFPDPGLEAAVRAGIGKPTGPITGADVAGFTVLNAFDRNITDLSGLECLVDLVEARIHRNAYSDITPVANLRKLEILYLDRAPVSDISAVQNLTELRELSVLGTLVTDISPVTNLSKLERIWINETQITDLNPLAGKTNLTHLRARLSAVSDVSPLQGLPGMIEADLRDCQLTNTTGLRDMPSLVKLDLQRNQINDISGIQNLPSIEILYLDSNPITDISRVDDFRTLVQLSFARCGTVTDISAVQNLTSLTHLWINSNQVTSIEAVRNLTNLTLLNIQFNQIVDIEPMVDLSSLTGELRINDNAIVSTEGLQNKPLLTRIRATHNQISDLSYLVGLPNMTILYIGDNQITDGELVHIAAHTQLVELSLLQNPVVDLTALDPLDDLEWLWVRRNPLFTNMGPLAGLASLKYFFAEHTGITDLSLLTGHPTLERMGLNFLNVTQPNLQNFPNLRDVNLNNSTLTSLNGMANLPALEQLRVQENDITDISNLSNLPSLTLLYLDNNPIVNIGPVASLPNIKSLSFSRCGTVSDISVVAGLTSLDELWLNTNQIVDTTPLAGLTQLNRLFIRNNLFPCPDLTLQNLEAAGVAVDDDCN